MNNVWDGTTRSLCDDECSGISMAILCRQSNLVALLVPCKAIAGTSRVQRAKALWCRTLECRASTPGPSTGGALCRREFQLFWLIPLIIIALINGMRLVYNQNACIYSDRPLFEAGKFNGNSDRRKGIHLEC